LLQAIAELANGPYIASSKVSNDIMAGLRTLHVARHERHFLLCRVAKGRVIEIGRIFHDQMDLAQHLPFPAAKKKR
jgi:toxin ParE1/3/4